MQLAQKFVIVAATIFSSSARTAKREMQGCLAVVASAADFPATQPLTL